MLRYVLVDIGWGIDLLPDGTKPLPEPMLTYNQKCSVTFILANILQEVLLNLFISARR